MKRFKKFVAVLLACVMALTLLTACGGGGGSSSAATEKAVGQQLTESINKKLSTNLAYDENLGPRFATAIHAAVAAGQKFDNINEAGAAIDLILEQAGFGDDTQVASTVAQKGNSVDVVASGLASSIKSKNYKTANKKIGYASSKLNVEGDYYIIWAVIE